MILGRPEAATTARATVSFASEPEWPSHTRPAARFGTMDLRFSSPVYPGETIRTEIWHRPGGAAFRAHHFQEGLDPGLTELGHGYLPGS